MTVQRLAQISVISVGVLASACAPADEPAALSDTGAQDAFRVTASLAASCSGCHGAGNAIVSLDGLSAEAIATSLDRYRTEDGTTVMHRLARGYTEAQVQDIAAYLVAEEAR